VRTWMMLCAVFGLVGCAESRQYFRPTEHVYGETMHGEREAIYDLVGPLGTFGEAKVWARGAFREHGYTVVHASLEVHNTSGVEIVVDPQDIRLDPVRAGADLLSGFAPTESHATTVKPGAFGAVSLRFVLPEHVHPGQISSFGLRWQVKNGPQTYSQRTPFIEEGYGRYYAGYPPPTMGFGYGFGYGYGCNLADPWCRGPYGFGGPIAPVYVNPPASHPQRETIRVR
jgi:hypothetical protein